MYSNIDTYKQDRIIAWAECDIRDSCNKYNLYKVKKYLCKMRSANGEQIESSRTIAENISIGKSSVIRHLKVLYDEAWIDQDLSNNKSHQRYTWCMEIEFTNTWLEASYLHEEAIKNERINRRLKNKGNNKFREQIAYQVKREKSF